MPTRNQPTAATFDGFACPDFIQAPAEFFDVLMPQLSECGLRCCSTSCAAPSRDLPPGPVQQRDGYL
jgi:hypothetical protein